MDVRALSAANAYASALGRAKLGPSGGDDIGAAPGSAGATPGKGPGFADMVKQAVGDVSSSTRMAEKMSVAGLSHKAELVDVVTAVTNAELTLETVVAVRDKVIQAYQEVMRMSI